MKYGRIEEITACSGVDQGCSLAAFGFAAAVAPETQHVISNIRTNLDNGAKLFTYLDDWYLWIRPAFINVALQNIKTQIANVNLELQPSKIQIWKAECEQPVGLEYQDIVRTTMNCLGGHLRIQGDIDNSPVELGNESQTMRTHETYYMN